MISFLVVFLFFIFLGALFFASIVLGIYFVYFIFKHLRNRKKRDKEIHRLNKKYLKDRLAYLP